MLTTHLCLVLRLQLSEAVPPFYHVFAWYIMRITSPLLYPYPEEICWGEEWMQLADDEVWVLGNVVIKLKVL